MSQLAWYPWLCRPLKNVKKLNKAVVESGLGKLECEGVTGTLPKEFFSGPGLYSIDIRLHEKAPFGFVSWQIRSRTEEMGEYTLKAKLMEIGKNAKSELLEPAVEKSGPVTDSPKPRAAELDEGQEAAIAEIEKLGGRVRISKR